MNRKCQSCGMSIETGAYCVHCVDENGELQEFSERFERMVQWQQRRGSPIEKARAEAIGYMSTMPAWKDHPEVLKRLGKS